MIAGAWVAMPLGMLLERVLAEQLGIHSLLIVIGLTYLITTLSVVFIPALRGMNRRSGSPANSLSDERGSDLVGRMRFT